MNYFVKLGESYSYLLYDFARWLIDEQIRLGNDTLYFCTREGEFFKQVVDSINTTSLKTVLLEVSRMSTFAASLETPSIKSFERLWRQYTQTMEAFFKTLDFSIEKVEKILNKYNLNRYTVIQLENDSIRQFFLDKTLENLLTQHIIKKKGELLTYLDSVGINQNNKTIAIVDIGWRGSIQDNLAHLLSKTTILGCYFGLAKFINEQPPNTKKIGYLNQLSCGVKFLTYVPIWEMLFNSPNGSVISYQISPLKVNKKIKIEENAVFEKCTRYVQQGILKKVNLYQNEEKNPKRIIKILKKIYLHPNKKLVRMYFTLVHNEEFGKGKDLEISLEKIPLKLVLSSVIFKKKRILLKNILFQSTWLYGLLTNENLSFVNYYFDYRLFK